MSNERTKHTPGPWMIAEGHRYADGRTRRPRVYSGSNETIAFCEFTSGDDGGCAHGNARLIAAAPELLEELREARAVALGLLGAMPPALQKKWPNLTAKAKAMGLSVNDSAAIAKATGGEGA